MKTHLILSSAVLALSLAACGNMSTQDKNTAGGAILTGGSAVGTVGGAAVGGVIGNKVDTDKKK